MCKYFILALLIGAILAAQICVADTTVNSSALNVVPGGSTNGLMPSLLIQKYGSGWTIEIDLTAQTNFSLNAWLKTTNRSCSTLQLWLTNGTEIIPTNQSFLALSLLPEQTTVTDIMKGVHPRSLRSLQWWRTEFNGSIAGETSPLASFSLREIFDTSFTNDVVLQISPLVYKVDADEVTASLVQFPPIKVRLMANGKVRKEEP